MHLKKRLLFSVIFFAVAFFVILAASYFFFTTEGSDKIVKAAFSRFMPYKSFSFEKIKGTLAQKLVYDGLVLNGLEFFPEGSILKVQNLDIALSAIDISALSVKIVNGVLKIQGFENIFFDGLFEKGQLDINLYSKNINIRDIVILLNGDRELKKADGTLGDVDVYIKGPVSEPRLSGLFRINTVTFNNFYIANSDVSCDLGVTDVGKEPKLTGSLLLQGGEISGPKTAVIKIKDALIIFKGPVDNPSLDVKGTSSVEKTKIDIVLKGSLKNPVLKLSSVPPLSQERLLVMLATGKSWKGTEDALKQGQLSADLVKDFLDYFIFSGAGSRLAAFFGITDLSVTYDKDKKGVGVKKSISDKIDATYAIEQSASNNSQQTVTQKIGGEYKVTDKVTLGAEKDLVLSNATNQAQGAQKTGESVNIKFKTNF